ncbi:MAG: Spy/CpxP family protein refolding chaperone [Acidobacteriota bacterium]|nr:Spy/CpxP family protein refolding chaperone [Acidobacteriota bacterium]
MRNKILAIAGIAVLVIGATVLALGHGLQRMHGQGKGEGRGHGDMVEHMFRELNLTDAQKQQVKAILEQTEATAGGIHTKLDEIRKQLDAATANGQFDETQVRSLASQKAQLDADMLVEHLRTKSKVFAILTPEQRTKAEELHKRGGPHGRRHGPPPPPPGY